MQRRFCPTVPLQTERRTADDVVNHHADSRAAQPGRAAALLGYGEHRTGAGVALAPQANDEVSPRSSEERASAGDLE